MAKAEMQPLGFLGIFKESTRIIRTSTHHFLCLVAALLLPLAVVRFISDPLIKVFFQERILVHYCHLKVASTLESCQRLLELDGELSQTHALSTILIILSVVLCVEILLSLASTASFTHSVCRGYLNNDLSVKGSLKTILKAFRGLFLTLVCMWFALVLFFISVFIVIVICVVLMKALQMNPASVVPILTIVSVVMSSYLMIIWSLAFVVSVAEENWGWEAMRRSAFLIKGRRRLASVFFALFRIGTRLAATWSLAILVSAFKEGSVAATILWTLLNVLVLSTFYVYHHATSAMFYLSCKSYHNESVEALPGMRSPSDYDLAANENFDVKYMEV